MLLLKKNFLYICNCGENGGDPFWFVIESVTCGPCHQYIVTMLETKKSFHTNTLLGFSVTFPDLEQNPLLAVLFLEN
jgi:hypothetical protein